MAPTKPAELETPDVSEIDKVESWRLHILLDAGYPTELAAQLAHSDADLHRAVKLIDDGCAHDVAAAILL